MRRLDAGVLRLELEAGAPLLLQRCGRSETVAAVQQALGTGVRVLDGRTTRSFADWDARRPTLASPTDPLVVLLDVDASARILREAPQTVSWAGGVRLPFPPTVRVVQTDEELRVGEESWHRLLRNAPEIAENNRGAEVAMDLGSLRVFVGRDGVLPLHLAQEGLDEGVVLLTRVAP